MSKRIVVGPGSKFIRNADPVDGESNWFLMRVYGNKRYFHYAVIIADDNRFEGL